MGKQNAKFIAKCSLLGALFVNNSKLRHIGVEQNLREHVVLSTFGSVVTFNN